MTYDEFVMAFVQAITIFAIGMYVIANDNDGDGV